MGFDNHAKVKVMCSSNERATDYFFFHSNISSLLAFACELVCVMGFQLGSLLMSW